MPICDTCGNDYDKAFTVTRADGRTATFDSIECAAVGLAPARAHTEGRWFEPSRDVTVILRARRVHPPHDPGRSHSGSKPRKQVHNAVGRKVAAT